MIRNTAEQKEYVLPKGDSLVPCVLILSTKFKGNELQSTKGNAKIRKLARRSFPIDTYSNNLFVQVSYIAKCASWLWILRQWFITVVNANAMVGHSFLHIRSVLLNYAFSPISVKVEFAFGGQVHNLTTHFHLSFSDKRISFWPCH